VGDGAGRAARFERDGSTLRFVPAGGGRGEGITEVTIAGLPAKGGAGPWVIGGVRFAGEEG